MKNVAGVVVALCLIASAQAQPLTRIETVAEMPGKSPEGGNWGADGALYLSSVNTFEVIRYRAGKMETFAKLPIHPLVIATAADEIAVNGHIDVADRSNDALMVGAGRVITLDYQGNIKKVIHVGSLPNSLAHYKDHLYFCSDTNEGKIWLVDTGKGTATVWMDDPLFKRVPNDRRAGINGVGVHDGYLYFASTVRESIYRIRLRRHGERSGVIERVGTAHYPDELAVAKDGTVYVATRNAIARIAPSGATTDLTDGQKVEGGPSVILAPDGKSLYELTQGRILRPPWGPPGDPQTLPEPPNQAATSSVPSVPKLLRIWLTNDGR